jgi:hypothetical protein
MSRRSSSRYKPIRLFLVRRQPSLWNNFRFHLRGIPIKLTYLRFAMHSPNSPNSRRNTWRIQK